MIRAINLIILLSLIWYIFSNFQEKQQKAVQVSEVLGTETTPDYYSENLELRQFSKDGKLQSLLKTERLEHYSDKQFATLLRPRLKLYAIDGGVKDISSLTGKISDNNQDLKLTDEVILLLSDENKLQKLKISTAELFYNVSDQRLWSDKLSNGISADGNFQSVYLQMDVKSDQLLLKDKVQIHYQLYELDIKADQLTSNPVTNVSRLQNNVELQHKTMTITGDVAEVQAAKDEKSKIFIINGQPVKFRQTLENSQLTAQAGQLIYIPSEQRMELLEKVVFIQQVNGIHMNVSADQLQLKFKADKPDSLNAQGSPVRFIHQLQERIVKIEAKSIVWESATKIAILSDATIIDGLTIFSADEIKYNTMTGEISAVGKGDSRPSYQYSPEQVKDST